MDNEGRKCRKTKLVPREINDSDEEIFALQSVVENALSKIKRPCKKVLPPVAIATPSILTNTSSIRELVPGHSIMPMNFDIKIEVEKVEENVEKQQEIISWKEIVLKSTEIYVQSNNICDKILHAQVLNTCKPYPKVFVKTPHEKLLDRAFTRWCDWASLTDEPKDPPLFYKCYICDMAWWHLDHFRDHIRTHEPSTLRVALEMNDYVECNIVAYINKSPNKYIANIEGKCWKCGEIAFEHTKLKNCSGCKKRFYSCSKLRQHQWYCEGFKKMHLDLFAKAEKIFKCHLCRFYFFKKEDSIHHMILRHSVRSDVPIPGCTVCDQCKGLMSYDDDHVCESKGYVKTCGACMKRVTKSSAAMHQIEGNTTCSVCKVKIVNNCAIHLHAVRHTMNYGLAYRCLTCKFFIIFDVDNIQKHKISYHSNREFDYDLISVPVTIVNRLKNLPTTKHNSPVDKQSQINHTFQLSNTQDDDDDDVIIIDDVPEVVVIPSDDAPTDLPCVIAKIKSEPLENEMHTFKTKTDTQNLKSEIKLKDICDVNEIDKVLDIDDIKKESNSEVNAVESLEIINTQTVSINEINTQKTAESFAKSTSDPNPLKNIKKSMDITYKEMEDMKKYLNSDRKQTKFDIEGMIPIAFVKTKNSQTLVQMIKNPNKIKKLRQYRPKIKQTLLTDNSRSKEAEVKMELIKSVQEKKVRAVNTQIIEDSTEQITPTPEKGKQTESVVEIEVPWDTVPIKEEADPEMDLKLSDIRRIYHINVNVGENEIDVKREINEFDVSGQGEDWQSESFAYSQHSTDDEFENDLITIAPNVTLNTEDESDDERNRGHRKKGKLYTCIRCNFKGVHRLYRHHKRFECRKSVHLYNCSCSLCKKSFDTIYKYLWHFKCHGVPELTCPQCGHEGVSINSLSVHVKVHIKSLFVSYRSLYSEDVMKAPVFRCKVCDSDVTRPDFIKHWDAHLDLENLNKRPKTPEVPESHLPHGFQTLNHDGKPDIRKALKLFMNPEKLMDLEKANFRVCILCSRDFKRRNDCKRHLIEHFLKNAYSNKTQYNGLRCQICGDLFDKIDMFRGHMRLHACLPVYKCEICNRTFSDSSNFSKHKKVHNFHILICDICKKKFNNKSYLAKHIQAHEKTPLIKCEKCKKTFVCRSTYKKHYRANHTTCARFRCHECSTFFSTTRDKWDHMWNVHREREFKADCNLCDAKYRKKSDLKRHMAKVHKMKPLDILTNADSAVVIIKREPDH